jgi:hypothetical protein
MHCYGKLQTCDGKPIYVCIIKSGPGSAYNGTVWCERCMGESFRRGNPYLEPIEKAFENQECRG